MDLLGQARGGVLMSQGSPDQEPVFAFPGMADQVGALYLGYGIMMALWDRARTGEGQEVDASLLGGQVALQSFNITGTLFSGKVPPRRRRQEADALWNVYRCRDDRFICISMAQGDRWWPLFCEAIERPDVRDDPRFAYHAERLANRGALITILDEVFAQKTQDEWVACLAGQYGVPAAAVQDYGQIADDPQVVANGVIVDYPGDPPGLKMVGPGVHLSRTPASVRTPAPEFGQHTEEVLLEAGFSWDEIERLKDLGAVGAR
jgi:crotonobetainyl-CoA:carnitine CoA-transferase CaiB-like acyl-CoA transferase